MNTPNKPPRPAHLAPVPAPAAPKTREELEAENAALRARLEPTKTPTEGGGGYLPGMGVSVPPGRGQHPAFRIEPHFNVTFGEHGTQPGMGRPSRVDDDGSEIPVSGHQKAKDALKRAGKQPGLVALLSSLLGAGGSIGAGEIFKKEPAPDKQVEVLYGIVRPQLEACNANVQRLAQSQERFQGWTLGYLKQTGVLFESSKTEPPPSAATVEIRTVPASTATVAPVLAPTAKGSPPKPAQVVISKDSLPPKPADVTEPVKLPETLPGAR